MLLRLLCCLCSIVVLALCFDLLVTFPLFADLYFTSTKRSIIDALLAMDTQDLAASQRRRAVRVPINRLAASERGYACRLLPFARCIVQRIDLSHIYICRPSSSATDPEGLRTVFGQLFSGLKNVGKRLVFVV